MITLNELIAIININRYNPKKSIALVIGNADYKVFPSLTNTINDVANLLRTPQLSYFF